MKKENRKMAQELRAKERAAAARRKKTQKIVITVLVLVAVAVVAAGIILTSTSVGKESSSSSESVVSASASSAGAVTGTSASAGTSSSSEKKLDTTKGTVVQAGDTINLLLKGVVNLHVIPFWKKLTLYFCNVFRRFLIFEDLNLDNFVAFDEYFHRCGAHIACNVFAQCCGVNNSHAIFLGDDIIGLGTLK